MLKSIWSFVWSFISGAAASLIANWQAIVAALAIGLVSGGAATWRVMSWKDAAAQTGQAKATIRLIERSDMANVKLGTIVIQQVAIAQGNTNRITEEIPIHVTPQIDSTYPVPLGFVRVWNDATHGAIPDSAAGADAEPSGVPLSDVATAGVADEGTLDICRVRLKGWQDWYTAQAALWNPAP